MSEPSHHARPVGERSLADLPFLPDLSEQQRLQLQWDSASRQGLPVAFHDRLRDGGDGPQLLLIPAGSFEMGSPPGEFGHRPEEGPQHYRHITRHFALGRCTITADEFARFAHDTGWRWRSDLMVAEGDCPVMNIRIGDAERYCAWLSEMTGACYRLPTEAMWEYACRAGTTTAYAFGSQIGTGQANFHIPRSPN